LAAISFPLGRLGFILPLLCIAAYPFCLAMDAFVLARQNRDVPLKAYQRWWMYFLALAAFYIANSLVAHTARSYIAEAFVVPTRSMSPTIQPGDRVLVDKIWCNREQLQRGDVVVFRSEGPGSPLYIMRLAGLPGDDVEIVNDRVRLNGVAVNDSHAFIDDDVPAWPELTAFGPIRIPADSFFVLGDNRRMSKDSRIIGSIPLSDLHGKARMIYWSHERQFPDPRDTSHYEQGPIGWDRIGTRLD
jgi:signal peptidase I